MTAEQTNDTQTMKQMIEANIARAEERSANIEAPEFRVYNIKSQRVLANGEIKEYTMQQRYVPKKRAGEEGKTVLSKQQAKLKAEVRGLMRDFTSAQLTYIKAVCEQLVTLTSPTTSYPPL